MGNAGPLVFIVDDDASVRRALSRLLEAHGFVVEVFQSSADLLSRPRVYEADCLVLDVRMPVRGGLEVQQILREKGLLNAAVFISGQSDIQTSVRAMKNGALDFLVKPVDEMQLIAAVNRAVDAGRAERERRAEIDALRLRLELLTPREREVCALVVSGMPNKQIAAQLGTTEKTVKVHRARGIMKMRARSLPELVRMADSLGLPTSRMTEATHA